MYVEGSLLGYSGAGFDVLNKMSGTEMRQIVEDNGLKCTSSHFTSDELKKSLDNRMQWALDMGMITARLPSF